ncbi:MAG TPA: SHOCT domain-containing protein [Actinomycetota bacterium]|nr:SHOCT domain-containing protein [Actinomycetota bacterium]
MMWGGGLFALICIALMIWMMMGHGMIGHGYREHGGTIDSERGPNAQEILAERFARGEISEEEFEQRKRLLK